MDIEQGRPTIREHCKYAVLRDSANKRVRLEITDPAIAITMTRTQAVDLAHALLARSQEI